MTAGSVATAWLDLASAWSPCLFQIGKTEPWLMAGLQLNHSLTSQNGYGEICARGVPLGGGELARSEFANTALLYVGT